MTDNRKIIHLDMDAFFAAIEQRDKPELRGKPIIVAGPSSRRGVVSTCSYEARVFGVHSAMPTKTAERLCPQGIFIPGNMAHYQAVSREIREIMYSFTPIVESASIDEAYLDVTHHLLHYRSATAVARALQRQIFEKLHLTASVGVSYNKFLAKIASDWRKPCGLTVIRPENAERFLEQLPIEKFFGIGRVTAARLQKIGVRTGKDLKQFSREALELQFGKFGLAYYDIVRGIDHREVETNYERKSYGREITFPVDLIEKNAKEFYLDQLSSKVAMLLQKSNLCGRTVTVKVRFENFETVSRSLTLPRGIKDGLEIYQIARLLLNRTEAMVRPVRLLGVALSNFPAPETESGAEQLELDLFPEDQFSTSERPILGRE